MGLMAKEFWNSPSRGMMDFAKVAETVANAAAAELKETHRIIIGTDSTLKLGGAEFVTAIIVHRVGHGGIYFWKRIEAYGTVPENRRYRVLRERIYQEAVLSLETARVLIDYIKRTYAFLTDLEIHVDVGRAGATREVIQEVVGMVKGSGFAVKTKPEAFAASSVADRHV